MFDAFRRFSVFTIIAKCFPLAPAAPIHSPNCGWFLDSVLNAFLQGSLYSYTHVAIKADVYEYTHVAIKTDVYEYR